MDTAISKIKQLVEYRDRQITLMIRRSSKVSSLGMAASIVPAVIVGGGRVGSALERMGSGKDVIISRGQTIPVESSGPIFVCTRNNVLDAIVDSTPSHRREDLVFFQNGMLEPWLERRGLADATQVLVYFAVAKSGDRPIDGKTDTDPDGLTAVYGKWSNAVATRLHSSGLSCKVFDNSKDYAKPLMEKLIWICAFMLVGARHLGATVGEVESNHQDEVCSLIKELASVASSEKALSFGGDLERRLCAYARSVAHFPTAVKERAAASGKPDPCPLHTSWLREVGAV